MERKGWIVVGVLAAFAFAFGGWLAWMAWEDGCRPDCPTHKLYVAYDGSVEEPMGCCPPRVKYERAELESAMPGLIPFLERSKTESLVHVKDHGLERAAVDHFGFGDADQAAPIEFEGHYYLVTWERLGDEE